MFKVRIIALAILIGGSALGYFVYSSETPTIVFDAYGTATTVEPTKPFKLGLDLAGGTQLIYRADMTDIAEIDKKDALNTLRDVIERRINIFGVSEPLVQIERGGALSGSSDDRLIIELPAVTDVGEAKAIIGETPLLEFKIFNNDERSHAGLADALPGSPEYDALFLNTGLTGRLLKRATLEFEQNTNRPTIALEFNSEGSELFASITRDNIGKVLAIFLDNRAIQMPVINEEIRGGRAQITGSYTPIEAREVVHNLNFGALPVPIELLSAQTVGATLGASALTAGVEAGKIGIGLVVLFLIFWYRLPGLIASLSLVTYVIIILSLFKYIPVTLTAAGLAGFILSIGMAVDASVLIFERIKEELAERDDISQSVTEGFRRAWASIRDANISSIITAVILYWFGTPLVKGFALTFGIGIMVSMFSAISVSRTFLLAVSFSKRSKASDFLLGSGVRFTKKNQKLQIQ